MIGSPPPCFRFITHHPSIKQSLFWRKELIMAFKIRWSNTSVQINSRLFEFKNLEKVRDPNAHIVKAIKINGG
jgi:hypothetical protein